MQAGYCKFRIIDGIPVLIVLDNIKKTTTSYFKVSGFPNDSTGYLVNITINIKKSKQKEWVEDMRKFINRTCQLGFDFDTSSNLVKSGEDVDLITYFLAFYNPKK